MSTSLRLVGWVSVGAWLMLPAFVAGEITLGERFYPTFDQGANEGGDDYFGTVVSIDGDRAIVGSPQTGVGGAVFFYHRTSVGWQCVAHFEAPTAGTGFGTSVAISGDYALAGAPTASYNGYVNTGVVHVYAFDSQSGWQDTNLPLVPSGSSYSSYSEWKWSRFGSSVAIRGSTIAVGAPTSDVQLNGNWHEDAGQVFLFTAGTKLNAQTYVQDDAFFGTCVRISPNGDFIIVGAPQEGAGAAYIFGAQTSRLIKSGLPSDARFGYAVDIDGEHAVVGAHNDSGGNGAAYVSERSGSNWSDPTALSNTASGAHIGYSVALRGCHCLVGTRWKTFALYYRLGAGGWGTPTQVVSGISGAGEYLGNSVSLCGDDALIGAPGEVTFRSGTGSVYFMSPPTLTLAASRKTHDGYGDYDIGLPVGGTPGVECRAGGVTTLVLTFSESIQSTNQNHCNDVQVVGATCTGATIAGSTMTVNLSCGDQTCVQVKVLTSVTDAENIPVAGNVTVYFQNRVGDVNADGLTDSADEGLIEYYRESPFGSDMSLRCDLDQSGVVDKDDSEMFEAYVDPNIVTPSCW